MVCCQNRITGMASALMFLGLSSSGMAFTPWNTPFGIQSIAGEKVASETVKEQNKYVPGVLKTSAAAVLASMIFFTGPALADEFGRETEAPTFFTGENLLVRS